MSKEDVKDFWEKIQSDSSLQEKLTAEVNPDDGWAGVVRFASQVGYSFTESDYGAAVEELPAQPWQASEEELTDEQLEQVAGGLTYSSSLFGTGGIMEFRSPFRKLLRPWAGPTP